VRAAALGELAGAHRLAGNVIGNAQVGDHVQRSRRDHGVRLQAAAGATPR
jgi:hypothetical protein